MYMPSRFSTIKNQSKSGFTLIELLVVIAIIGLLSSVVLASVSTTRLKARDARRLTEIVQIQLAFQLYLDNNINYPPSGASFWVCLGHTTTETCWDGGISGNDAVNAAIEPFFSKIPDDPLNNTACFGDAYAYASDGGTSATLHWYYENDSAPIDKACGRGVYGGSNSCGSYCYLSI